MSSRVPRRPRGCLVTNSAAELASRDRGTGTRVGAVLAKIEAAFERAVGRAQAAGEIDPKRNARALARFLTSSAQGLSVMARASPDRTWVSCYDRVKSSKFQPLSPLDDRGPISTAIRGRNQHNPYPWDLRIP
jgi:Tetracyclin repressor-like, C-terminal domain